MNEKIRTKTAELFTEIVLETFRFNGRLIEVGNELTKEVGLTSALWQVLGATKDTPVSMAQIARNMGLSRQGARRSVNILLKKGLVRFEENPDHKRAKLVTLTDEGKKLLNQLTIIHTDWSNSVSKEYNTIELERVVQVIKDLREKI